MSPTRNYRVWLRRLSPSGGNIGEFRVISYCMRLAGFVLAVIFAAAIPGSAQTNSGFSGKWKLNPSRSEIHKLSAPPAPYLNVEESGTVLTVSAGSQEAGPFSVIKYPLNSAEAASTAGGSTMKTLTKWEGSALLVNTIVSGPENYTIMERWNPSRSGSTLTIRRTIVRRSGEIESLLVYENGSANATDPEPELERPRSIPVAAPAASERYIVESGTRLLLRLVNSVDTKHTAPGDKVYLSTMVPVFVNRRLVIPAGSSVLGTVTESKGAGRVKGRSALTVRFDSLTLPNGVTRDLRSRPSSADARGDLDRAEGRIKGEGNKGGDTRTVGTTTAAGAGIGAMAGGGVGAGIGAAAGAVAGLAGVLGSRGPQVVLPAGSTMELTLDRNLDFVPSELSSN